MASTILRRRRSLDDEDDRAVSSSTDSRSLVSCISEEDVNFFGIIVKGGDPISFRECRYIFMKRVILTAILMIMLSLVGICGHDLVQGSVSLTSKQTRLPTYYPTSGVRQRRNYHYWSSEEIQQTLLEWNSSTYHSFVHVTSAQKAYHIPTPGNENDCPFDTTTVGCQTWILSIQTPSQPDVPRRPRRRSKPQVFLSGALHGDERVGPTAVMETASLLLEVAQTGVACYSVFRGAATTQLSPSCRMLQRKLELQWGISTAQRQWLLRLVQTRHILIVPTANALGYFRNAREEGTIDPNRDFPYDMEDTTSLCLQSMAARSIVSLLQDELVQLGITFHAGTEAIAYEWGAYSHLVDEAAAPDVVSQRQISQAYQHLSRVAASSKGQEEQEYYPIGTMNEVVYPVHGGMEDWAYAASWDTADAATSTDCFTDHWNATLLRTNDASFRAFIALVETSHDKQPPVDTLGISDQVLVQGGSGFINRNMRLSLAMIDLVEPYIFIQSIEDNGSKIVFPDDDATSCTASQIAVPSDRESIEIAWRVGGAVTVEETRLVYGTKRQLGEMLWSYCPASNATQPALSSRSPSELFFTTTSSQAGTTQWHANGETLFRATLDLSKHPTGTDDGATIRVFAVARVDADWSGGQTHVARVRTDPSWFYQTAGGATVQGQVEWFSVPLTIVMGTEGSTVRMRTTTTATASTWPPTGWSAGSSARLTCSAVAVLLVAFALLLWRHERRVTV